jgi:hypothetical protein
MAKEEFHAAYLEAEEKYRKRVMPLHIKERQLRESLRTNTSAPDEEKQRAYMESYEKLLGEYEEASNTFIAQTQNTRSELEKELHSASGADHLIQAAGLSAEQREQLLGLALGTAQPALARAVAQVARQNGELGTFDRWANDDPQRREALKRYRGMPDLDRLTDRVNAMKPPRADAHALRSTAEDERKAEEEARANDVRRKQFFSLPEYGTAENPIRQVGRRPA